MPGSNFNKVSALLRSARRQIVGNPLAFDLDALLAISLSESDRLAKQPIIADGVQVILSADGDQEPSVSDDAEEPKP